MPDLNIHEIASAQGPSTSQGDDDSRKTCLQWYALAVKPRHDKAVARSLEAKGFQAFVPLYKKRNQYAVRYKDSDLPLFPGYIFCRFDALFRLPIITTPGIIQILGNGNSPIAVSETEITSLQRAIKAQVPLQPYPFLQIGQRVRIEEGVLSGVVGVIVKLKQNVRLVLSITLLQRSVLLEVNQDQVSSQRVL